MERVGSHVLPPSVLRANASALYFFEICLTHPA